MPRTGRPVKWTAEKLQPIFDDMAEHGRSLKQVCADHKANYGAVFKAIQRDKDISELYARARDDYLHTRVASMDEIARTEPDVQRARLRIDNIKWEASKVMPKQYGDKVQTEHTGNLNIEIVRFGEDGSAD